MTDCEQRMPDATFVGARWETEATIRRGALIRAARNWREYRRNQDAIQDEEYALLCDILDHAIGAYEEIIRAY